MFLVSTADQMLHLGAVPPEGRALRRRGRLEVIDSAAFLVSVQVLAVVSWPNPILAHHQLGQFTYLKSPLCF